MGKNRKLRRTENALKAYAAGVCGEIKMTPEEVCMLFRIVDKFNDSKSRVATYERQFHDINDNFVNMKDELIVGLVQKFKRLSEYVRLQQTRMKMGLPMDPPNKQDVPLAPAPEAQLAPQEPVTLAMLAADAANNGDI